MARLGVRGIDDNMLAEFKNYVKEKHGKLHTAMGLEVESALRFLLPTANIYSIIYKALNRRGIYAS